MTDLASVKLSIYIPINESLRDRKEKKVDIKTMIILVSLLILLIIAFIIFIKLKHVF